MFEIKFWLYEFSAYGVKQHLCNHPVQPNLASEVHTLSFSTRDPYEFLAHGKYLFGFCVLFHSVPIQGS